MAGATARALAAVGLLPDAPLLHEQALRLAPHFRPALRVLAARTPTFGAPDLVKSLSLERLAETPADLPDATTCPC